jgi:hypothetical protein
MEQLVDEAGRGETSSASHPSGRSAGALGSNSQPMAAAQAAPRIAAATGGPEPLKLAMSVPTERPSAPAAEDSSGRSRTLLFVALASTIVLGGVALYVWMERNQAAERARTAQAEVDRTPTATSPTEPGAPPTAAENPSDVKPGADPAPQPTAAEPAAPAPVAGPDVPVVIQAKPRNAEIWIGNKKLGTSPFTAKLPSNLPVEISLRSHGFATVTRSITPREGAPAEVFELGPLPYELVVTTEPAGATIASAGKSAVSPAPLELGHVEAAVSISVDKEGFQRSTRSLKLDEFHEEGGVMRAQITLSLAPTPAPRRRAPARAPAASPTSPTSATDAPPAPEPAGSPPVMQVKPEGESHPAEAAPAPAAAPEAKAKPAEPPQTAAAPAPPPAPPEPAPN